MTDQPRCKAKLDVHVQQRLREQINIMYRWETIDGEDYVALREGGEAALWDLVQESISEAGWQICNGFCL